MANEVNESTKWLYEQLNGKGYNVGKDVNEFDSLMRSNADSRQWAYDTAKKSGLNVGKDIDEFSSLVGGTTTSAPVVEPAPIPANDIQPKTEAEQEAWKPTPMQKAFMIKSVQSSLDDFNNNSNSLIQHTRNMAEYMKHGESIVGQPAKAGLHLNPEAGSVEEAYITPSGYKTTDKAAADNESFNHRRYVDNMTVAGQLRRAGRDLDYLTDKAAKRRAEIIDEVRKRQQGVEAASGLLDKIYQGIRSGDTMTSPSGDFMDEVNDVLATDREYRALEAARREAEKRVQTIQHENDRQEDKDVGFWRGLREVVSDSRTWDFGFGDMRDAMTKVAASSKRPENRSDAEHMMIEQAYEAQQAEAAYSQNDSFWNRAGVMTGEMLPFMLDFAIMGGAKSGATTVTRGLDAILLRSIHKTAPKVARNKAVQWTTKALGALPEDLLYRAPLMTNTVQGMKTSADIIDRKLGDAVIRDDGSYDFSNDKTWGSAVWQGEANAIIENYSEMFGPHLEGALSLKTVGKLADTFGAKRLSGMLTKASNSELAGITGTMQKHLDRLGVSDYFGEVGEEYYGQLWRTMLNLDDAYKQNPDGSRTNLFLDGQFHGDIWGGMALSMGLMGAGKYTLSAAAYGSMKHRVNKTDARASETFTPEVWEGWRERIDGTTNDKVGEMAEAIVADPTLTDEQRTAAMNYMEASLNLRGFNLASVAHQRGGEPSEEEVAANESYMDGYSAETPQEMNDAKRMLALQRQRLASSLSEDVIPEFDADPIGALSRTHDSELRRIASDYVNAKQVYEGMIQRVRDDIDGRIAQSDAMIDSRVNHQTGMIQPATMKIDDRKVYIVNGTVSMYDDGSGIDIQNSSESIIIRDAETGKVEFTDPTQLFNIEDGIDAEAEKDSARSQIIEETALAAADNIDGVLSFTPGDIYPILDLEGNQQSISVLGQTADENGMAIDGHVDIQYSDGSIEAVATSDLQQWVDKANEQRVAQFIAEQESEPNSFEIVEPITETQPESIEAPQKAVEINPETENSPLATEPDVNNYEETPASFISRIPVDESTGEPIYEQAEPADAWDAIVESAKGNEDKAQRVVESMVSDMEAEVKRLEKQKPNKGRTIAEKMAAEDALEEARTIAQSNLSKWKAIAGVRESRITEAQRLEAEAELKRQIEADQEARRIERQARDEERASRPGEYAKAMSAWEEPTSIEERILRDLSSGGIKLRWSDKGKTRGLGAHLFGGSNTERRWNGEYGNYKWLVDDNAGLLPEEYAEHLAQEYYNDYENDSDHYAETFVTVLDVLGSYASSKDMWERAQELHQGNLEAQASAEDFERMEMEARGITEEDIERDRIYREKFGMPEDEWDEFYLSNGTEIDMPDEEYSEYFNNLAGLRADQENEQQGLQQTATDTGEQGRTDTVSENSTGMVRDAGLYRPEASEVWRPEGNNQESSGDVSLRDDEGNGEKGNIIQSSPSDINLEEQDAEEDVLRSRIEVKDDDWTEGNGYTPTLKRTIIIDGTHNVTQVDTPNDKGDYTGSVFEYDGKTFGDLQEVIGHIDSNTATDNGSLTDRTLGEMIAEAEAEVNTDPTDKQKEAGNYKKGHVQVGTFDVTIENPKGSKRSGTDADGKKWETEMKHTYGYIRGTKGVDGDNIDVFASSDIDAWDGSKAFVVDQYNPDGSFDEHKVMLGFNDREEAFGAYLSNYEAGWENGRRLDVTAVNLEDFEKWIDSSKRKTKPFTEYKSVKSKEAHSMVGRSLSEQDATDLIAQMEANAEIAPATELTPENWITQFGEDGTVDTPLGVVKMGANQLLKLYSLKRTEYFGMIHPTLNSPDVIIEKNAPAVGAERDSKYLFVKTFIKSDGSRLVHFESVTVKRDGMEVSISSHEAEGKAIKKEMQNGKILHLSERLSSGSERYLTEAPSVSEGPDLVPTSDNNIVETPEPTDKRTGTDDNPMDKRGDTALPQDSDVSSGKGNTLSADKQGSGVESSEDYAIKSKPYTNKQGKTLDTYLVTFNRDFSKQEKSSLRKMAKDKKGWYDRETGGWMLRSREDADAFAKNVMSKNDTQLSAEAPLSIDNMKASAKIHNEITPKEPTSSEIISGSDLSKLDESLRNEIMNYISEYPCAPLMVISDNGDIDNLNMPDWFKEELKEEVSQGNTIAGYCNLDKKIYIFANAEKACPTHETLLHENTHAIVDELGDDCLGFLTSFKEIVAQLSFNNGVFQVILDGIKEEYVEEKVSNEFLAYSLQYAARYPEVLNRIKQALDPKTLEYLEVKILNKLYGQRNESQKSKIRKDVHETFSGVREEDAKNISGTQSGDRGQSSEAHSENSQGAEQSGTDVEAISPKNPSGNKLVTDEQYAELLAKMRKKMGGQLNMGVDPEILAIGSMMAVYHIERGARKFAEYVKAMVADLGEKFPARYLKGFYKAAHEMIEDAAPEIADEMDSDDVVSGADIVSILSGRIDAMATAEMVVAEGIAEQERQEAEKKLKEDRNKRLNSDGSTFEVIDEGNIKTDVTRGDFIPGVRKNKGKAEWIDQTEESKKKKSQKKSVSSQSERPNLFGDSLNQQTPETTDSNGQERIGKENRGILRETPRSDSRASLSLGAREMESGLQGRRNDRKGDRGIPQGAGNELGSTQRPPRRLPRLNENELRNTRNNRAERGTDYAPKGDDARIKANIAAIELVHRLTESGEQATPEQMETLRKFSGWGGLGKAFTNKAYADRIRALLGDSYQDAVDSRKSAYYTPAAVIDSLWDIVKAMGFQGGTILEGSAGIGNILGLMPEEISERSEIRAVEVDSTTGSILSLLYPDAQVDIQGFEETKIENGSIDLAITNVPFITGWNVIDKTGDKDLSKKFKDIHDFCIAKNIRKLRDGGIGIFITSSGTLDNSAKLRAWVTNEGNSDVVGAFRLHNETFGGTGATSDIIVVRKRVNGKKSAHAIDVSEVSGVRTAEYDTGETKKVTIDGHKQEVPVVDVVTMDYNRYFVEHPEQMAGEMHFGFEKGETYRAKSKALYPVKEMNQEAMLSAWAQSFSDMDFDAVPTTKQEYETTYDTVGNEVKVGSMVIDDRGRLCVNSGGIARPLMSARKNKQDTRTDDELISMFNSKKIKGRTRQQCLKDYNGIKKALADVLEYQTTHEDNEGLEPLLSRLNATFDSFVSRYGNLHKNNQLAWLRNDVDYPGILALETYEERGDESGNRIKKFGKTDIFSRRVVEKETIPQPKNVKDGIITSLYISGRVDVGYISEQLGISEKQVREEIVSSGLGFENPVSREMEVSYEYLSGNVREKLRQATANNTDGKYDTNIKALEKVVPMNIPAHLIEFALGSSWIEPQLYEDYVKERTGVNVNLTNVGGTWFMKTSGSELNTEQNRSQGVYSEELEKTVLGHEILEAAITNRSISVSRTYKRNDGTYETIIDRDATQAVAAKVDEFRMGFKDWARAKMQGDMEMSARMETVYNDRFNNSVPRSIPDEFIPKHFGGQVTEMEGNPFSLRPHQAKAVIRGTTQSQLLAHEVGTGKTFTLISTAMEMRRLGTARKPMIVVQNATVGQFVESAKALYPNAKVLTLEDADRNAQGRKDFYAKIRYNDWDMIVIPQSVLDMIPDSEERQIRFIQDKIAEKMLVLQLMAEQDPDGSSWITKQAEKEISDLENDLAKITASLESKRKEKSEKDMKKEAQTRHNAEVRAMEMLDRTTDDVENFDQMGIDALLVDEAHEYKHLGFATAMQRGVKGVDPSYSKKAQGLYLKTQAVMERNRGRNVIFATGTPISNTAAEIWTFMRYLMSEDEMRDYGIYYFDDFVRNFGNLQQMLEFATNGKFKENNRFAGYVNLPELVRIWSTVTDTVLTREAGGVSDKIPDMEGGKAQDIYLPQTKALRSVMLYVKSELDRYDNMTGKEKKANSHIPLTMYGIAKAAAVDARLVYSDAADESQSKTNEAVRQTLHSLEETSDYKGTVAIFADNYQNKQSGFNLYEDIRRKLIEQGVPAEQIVVMKSGMTVKKKLEIFDKVNAGEVRVILGSTYTLGTGVNIQERLHTLIHLDAPNRPMDYTQRNGRILRQGNLHKDMGLPVRVLRFGVEDSLDVTAYQRLKTKGAIADSIMNGSKMMENSMETRSLEEDEDVFGDITAQLSGSEYAMLKNQAEKEVRKLNSKLKQWEADQTYIHNQIPRLRGQIRESEKRQKTAQENLDVVRRIFPNGTFKTITIGKQTFSDLESMNKLFTEHNKSVMDMSDQIRDNKISGPQTRKLTIDIDGLKFEVTTVIDKEIGNNGGNLFFKASRRVTYSCTELQGVEDIPVSGARLKGAVEDIVSNVITGKGYADMVEAMQSSIGRNQTELQQIEQRQGKEFEFYPELAEAKARLEEYTEKMKAELAEKEAKYANMDADVEVASDISLTEEDSEETEEEDDVRYRLEEASDRIEELFEEAVAGNLKGKAVEIGRLTQDGRDYLEMLSGLLFKENVSFVLNPSDLLHIYKRHFGKNETDGRNIPLTIEDIRNISDIITNPDKVVYAREKDGQKRNMFFFLKGTADGSYNLMEIYSDSKGNLTAKSFFKSKEGVSQRAMLLHESSTLTSVTDGATLSDDAKLPKFFELSTDEDAESLERAGTGTYSDAEVSMEGDPWSKAWGESIRTKRQQKQFAEKERNRMRERAKSLSSVLGIDIEVIDDASTLKGKKQRAKGWYDTKTGKITVVVSNHNSASDMEATILHEAVAHHGLRQLLGEHFDEFLDKVYEAAENNIKEQIDLLAIRNGWNRRIATEEYLAGLAERTDFDRAQEHVGGWFDKIKRFFFDMLFKAGFKHITPGSISDNELRYILWRSYQNLVNPGRYRAFEWEAEDVAMQYKLQVGEYDANSNNAGTAADEDIRFRDGDFTPRDRVLAAQQYERMLSRGSWQFREATQDSMLGLKALYESILGSNLRIENVDGYENAYLYENRMSSANNGEQHQYFSRFMKPLLESIHKLCGSKELDRRILTDYMIAKHGLERNKYMRNEAAANGEDTERDFAGLCGLTGEDDWHTAETVAQQMVDDYEANHDTAELWNNVKKATNATLEKIYLSGLISEDTFNKVLGMYDFYIPLRGWDETTSDKVYGYLTSNEGPLSGGNVFKRAGGRPSKSDDPIAFIAKMADDAIRQGNRNIMKQRFLNFVLEHPSDLVSVNDVWLEYNDVNGEWKQVFADLQPDMTHTEVESEIAKFEAKMEALRTAEPDKYKKGRDARNIPYKVVRGNLNEHQVLVKRNGRTYVMTINGNPRAAQALNGLTNPDTDMGGLYGKVIKGANYVNRQLSAFYTTRNPDFVVSNFLRDMLYSNCMTWVKENPRYALRFHKNFGKVNPLSLRRLLSKWENDSLSDSNYLEKMFKEFMLNGGETGYTSVKNIEGHKRTIASELKKQGSAGRKAWSALGMQLDLLNRSAENCARFAAFLTSREMGRTLDRSIHDAKEVSVNFNKKGSGDRFVDANGQTTLGKTGGYLGGVGRSLYVFWNAGIQGMTNFGRAGKRNPGKALGGAAALFTLGYVIPLLAQMLGGGDGDDDDKNAYYNLPEYVRRSNICFKAGEQWITIPLPIEYRAIYGMGELACGVISGNERYSNSELAYYMAAQISQTLPLDFFE